MSGGKVFICHRLAYLQLPLDDNSKELVTINTHKLTKRSSMASPWRTV